MSHPEQLVLLLLVNNDEWYSQITHDLASASVLAVMMYAPPAVETEKDFGGLVTSLTSLMCASEICKQS
jgi:hypothetical protein